MKRSSLVLVLAVLGCALFAQAAAARGVPPQRYHAKLTQCQVSDDARSGSLEVDASVAPIRGAVRLGLRFDLYRRAEGAHRFRRASAPRLSMWRHSSLRVKSYEVGQAVDGLTAPAAYEMRVGFRWYGRHGRVLATRYRITRLCRQPDRRPDLRVGLVTTSVSSDPQNPVHYEAELYNAGLSDAGPFDTVLRSRGAIVGGPARVAGLAAQATVSVGFDGPPCTSTTAPVIAVDSGGEVSERHEGNNRVRVRCAA